MNVMNTLNIILRCELLFANFIPLKGRKTNYAKNAKNMRENALAHDLKH